MNFANETKFRQHVVAAIRKGGGFAQQIESPTLRGIPDVFYVNPCKESGWLELKIVRPRDKRNDVSVSAAQWLWAHKAVKHGVRVHVTLWDQFHQMFGFLEVDSKTTLSDIRCLGLYSAILTEKEFDKWITSL